MKTGKTPNGKLYAGSPHEWFGRGEVALAETSRRGSLLCNRKTALSGAVKSLVFGVVALVTCAASALTVPTPTASKGTYTGSIKVTWNAVTGARKYQVRYGTSSSYSSSLVLKTMTGRSLTVTGVTAGKTYYFWVCPYDSKGVRWYNTSKYAYGYAKQSTKVTLSGSGSTSGNTLTWTVSGTAPSSYKLYRSVVNNYSYATLLATLSSSTRRYSDTKASTGTTYYYWLCYKLNDTWYRVGSVSAFRPLPSPEPGAYISGASSLRAGSSAKYYLYVGGKKVSATWSRSGQATMQSHGTYGLLKATNKPISTFKVKVYAKYKGKTYSKTVTITR